jgi:hypothetical protein
MSRVGTMGLFREPAGLKIAARANSSRATRLRATPVAATCPENLAALLQRGVA